MSVEINNILKAVELMSPTTFKQWIVEVSEVTKLDPLDFIGSAPFNQFLHKLTVQGTMKGKAKPVNNNRKGKEKSPERIALAKAILKETKKAGGSIKANMLAQALRPYNFTCSKNVKQGAYQDLEKQKLIKRTGTRAGQLISLK